MDEKPAITQEQLDALKKELQKDIVEDMVVETYQPKKNCRKCHGLGRIGFVEGDPNKPYYCNCIVKIKKVFSPAKTAVATPVPVPAEAPAPVENVTNDPKASV